MKIFLYILSIAVLMAGGCIAAKSSYRPSYDFSQVEKVAIVAVEGAVKSETAKDQIADFFAMELLDKGYAPIGRAQVRALLKEQELESPDLTTAGAAMEVGAALDVPVVMVIDIPRFGQDLTMTAKMIDVSDGSTIWIGKGSGRSGGHSAPSALLGVITGQQSSRRSEEDELMTGPLAELFAGQTNQALTPAEEEKIQRTVKNICSTLPIRSSVNW
jgi:hypothetical protein